MMSMTIHSTAFAEGDVIPRKHTGDGEDVSPPLAWAGVSDDTKELAIICDDPDAPTAEPWVHWVIYKIAPTIAALPQGIPSDAQLDTPIQAFQGQNSWPTGRTIGYRGPAPPPGHGIHHYHFKLYALDCELDVAPRMDKSRLLASMDGHVLAQGELVGTYQR